MKPKHLILAVLLLTFLVVLVFPNVVGSLSREGSEVLFDGVSGLQQKVPEPHTAPPRPDVLHVRGSYSPMSLNNNLNRANDERRLHDDRRIEQHQHVPQHKEVTEATDSPRSIPSDATQQEVGVEDAAFRFFTDALRQRFPRGGAQSPHVRSLKGMQTTYRKIRCGAVVQPLCWREGQPRYFTTSSPADTKSYFTRSGGTTLCNEAVRKTKLHMVMYATNASQHDVDRPAQLLATKRLVGTVDGGWGLPRAWNLSNLDNIVHPMELDKPITFSAEEKGEQTESKSKEEVQSSAPSTVASSSLSVLIVPFCWETYGYHLLLCVMSAWSQLERTQLRALAQQHGKELHVRVAFLKGSGLFPFLTGSSSSWWEKQARKQAKANLQVHDPSNKKKNSEEQLSTTPYWGLWSVLAAHPSHVRPAPYAPSSCFDFAIFGHQPSQDTTPLEQRKFSSALKHVVLGTVPLPWSITSLQNTGATSATSMNISARCRAQLRVRVLLIQRKQRYRIQNLSDVEDQIDRALLGEEGVIQGNRSTLILEDMDVRAQILAASEADILIGVHGNGLSWSMLMAPASVLIELWPSAPYNRNYAAFAQRGNLLHLESRGDGTCAARCGAQYAEVGLAVKEAIVHLKEVRCDEKPFDSTHLYEEAKQRKKQSRK